MTGQHVWVLTDESNAGDLGDTLSCIGVFTSRERALDHFRRDFSLKTAERIAWRSGENPDMWEGHDQQGEYAFLLTRFEVDGEE